MTLIPELRAELATTLERRARRRRRWLFGLTPVALVATGGIALAASGALNGADAPAPLGTGTSDADSGVVGRGHRPPALAAYRVRPGAAALARRPRGLPHARARGRGAGRAGAVRGLRAARRGRAAVRQRRRGAAPVRRAGAGRGERHLTTPTGAKHVRTSGPEGAYLIESARALRQRRLALSGGARDHRDHLPRRPRVHAAPVRRHGVPAPRFRALEAEAADAGADRRAGHRHRAPGPALLGPATRFRAASPPTASPPPTTCGIIPTAPPHRAQLANRDRPRSGPGRPADRDVVEHLNGGGEYRIIV